MKKVKMLKTELGVREGNIHPEKFNSGQTYTIDNSLARQFNLLSAVEFIDETIAMKVPVVSDVKPEKKKPGRPKKED